MYINDDCNIEKGLNRSWLWVLEDVGSGCNMGRLWEVNWVKMMIGIF
jgi:hypothetical protein